MMNLSQLVPGERGWVKELTTAGSMRRRFLDMGLVGDTEVECVGRSPAGDPSAYRIRGAVIAIRARDSRSILLQDRRVREC